MSNQNYKQAKNVERRTWDRETYEAKAKARAKAEKSGGSTSEGPLGTKRSLLSKEDEELKEEFMPAVAGAAGPEKSKRAYLKARSRKVDIDSKIGSTEMISVEEATVTQTVGPEAMKNGVIKTGVGWHCKVCDCFLKDSHTYLDHINGRKHQRKLGYTMRTEKSTQEQVQDRLKRLVEERNAKNEASDDVGPTDYRDVIKKRDKAEELKKVERAKRRAARRKMAKETKQNEHTEAEGIDPGLAAMMGFSGFGGGNKNH